jgi:O-antigen polymerase
VDLKNKIQHDHVPKTENILPLHKGKHNYFYGLSTYINVFALLFIVFAGLVNADYFYSSTAVAYYGFCVSALFFVIGNSFFYSTKNAIVIFKSPILLFGLWCSYVLVHYFTNTGTLVFTIYSVTFFLLLLKATEIFSSPNFKFKLFFAGIAGIAAVEAMYCIAQFLGLFKSQNKLFAVTGSWNNPNVTAIFLALIVPVFFYLFQGKYKKIVLSGFLSLLIALLLLKCRAAFIGTVLSIIVFYVLECQFINWIRNKKNDTSAKALLILGLLIIIPLSSQLYNAKKASADGRKFIWKVSAIMASEKPVTGYGYGFFEKEYNLYQVNYIQNDKATIEEQANAGPVIMPHNELIQNTVEGGSLGLVLISLFFGSLLFAVKQKNRTNQNEQHLEAISQVKSSHFHLAYAGVVAFVGMSMVNSTIQIVPVMCLLVVYAAIVCSTLKPLQLSVNLVFFQNNKTFSILSKTTTISISFYLLYLIFGMATADRQNKKAKLLKETRHYEQALHIMPDLEPHLQEDSNYWKNYGSIYFELHKYQAALNCFKKAQTLSSLPEIYGGTGICHKKLKHYPQAIQQYETLVDLYPSKFSYRMLLLETYLKNKDVPKAIALAQEIIQLKPKIPSEKVNRYKNMCRVLLKKIAPQKENRKKFQFQ